MLALLSTLNKCVFDIITIITTKKVFTWLGLAWIVNIIHAQVLSYE
jgi:hypothetical protein